MRKQIVENDIDDKRQNRINGKEWLRYSVSVWGDIEKSAEERALKHPAMFPFAIVERLIDCFAGKNARVLVDPFLGSGSALLGAFKKGLSGIGFEVVPEFANLACQRLSQMTADLWSEDANIFLVKQPTEIGQDLDGMTYFIINEDVRISSTWVDDEIADILITSPPYWNIHRRKRTADGKNSRPYSNQLNDLGNIEDYGAFLSEIERIFREMCRIQKTGTYAIINVMDLRYGAEFVPFHIDIIKSMQSSDYKLEDIIIWDRAREYNNLRPLGYPYKFIVNKVHEYLLIFAKR